MQLSDPHPTLTLLLSIWAGLGPMVGLGAGHFLTRSWQREQWLRDQRRTEYREVITALVSAGIDITEYLHAKGTLNERPKKLFVKAFKIGAQTIMDRVYIAKDLETIKAGDRYLTITESLHAETDFDKSATRLTELLNEIVALAQEV